MKKMPCTKECPKRHKLCHHECKEYIVWKQEYDSEKLKVDKIKNDISIVEEYKSRRSEKIRRRYNEVNHIH
jgi:hypothetical protein